MDFKCSFDRSKLTTTITKRTFTILSLVWEKKKKASHQNGDVEEDKAQSDCSRASSLNKMPLSPASCSPVKSKERRVIHLTCPRGEPRVLTLSLLDRVERGGSGWSREASVFGPYLLHCADSTKSYHRKPGSVWIRKFGFFPWRTVTYENCQSSFLSLLWVYNAMGFGSNQRGADSSACMTCVGLSSSPSSCYHGVIFFCFLLFQEENVLLLPRPFMILCDSVLTLD